MCSNLYFLPIKSLHIFKIPVNLIEVFRYFRDGSINEKILDFGIDFIFSKIFKSTSFCLSPLPKSSLFPSLVGVFLIRTKATVWGPSKWTIPSFGTMFFEISFSSFVVLIIPLIWSFSCFVISILSTPPKLSIIVANPFISIEIKFFTFSPKFLFKVLRVVTSPPFPYASLILVKYVFLFFGITSTRVSLAKEISLIVGISFVGFMLAIKIASDILFLSTPKRAMFIIESNSLLNISSFIPRSSVSIFWYWYLEKKLNIRHTIKTIKSVTTPKIINFFFLLLFLLVGMYLLLFFLGCFFFFLFRTISNSLIFSNLALLLFFSSGIYFLFFSFLSCI